MEDDYFGFSSEPDSPENVPENERKRKKNGDAELEEVSVDRGKQMPPQQEKEKVPDNTEGLSTVDKFAPNGDLSSIEDLPSVEDLNIEEEKALSDAEVETRKRTKGNIGDADEMEKNPALTADDDQLSDILLVMNQEEKTVKAVKGIDKDGKLQTVPVEEENKNSFLKLDSHGSILSNFFKNFMSQVKNPTEFKFLKIPMKIALKVLKGVVKIGDIPPEELEKIIKQYEVKAKQQMNQGQPTPQVNRTQATTSDQQNQQVNSNGQQMTTDGKQQTIQPSNNHSNMEQKAQDAQTENQYRYNPEKIDWDSFKDFGVTKEKLEKAGMLDTMLKGYKTPFLMPIALNAGAVILRQDARLAFREKPDGSICLAIHGIRKQPDFKMPFLGHNFSDEDKKALKQSGNMGRIIELEKPGAKGEKIMVPSIISIDRLTNELVALPADRIKIPEKIGGVTLSEEQKQHLSEGKSLKINGLTSKEGKVFDATVQFNAEKRYVEYVDVNKTRYQQGQNQSEMNIPDNFRQIPISEEKQKTLKELGTIYMEGFQNKENKPYQGYVYFNVDKGRLDFKFPHEYHEAVKKGEIQPVKEGDGPIKSNTQTNKNSNKTQESENGANSNKNSEKNQDEEKAKKRTQKVAPKKKGKKI